MNLQEHIRKVLKEEFDSEKLKFDRQVKTTQTYEHLINRFKIEDVDGEQKMVDTKYYRTYYIHGGQIGKTIQSICDDIRYEISKMEGEEQTLIKIFKRFCNKLFPDCDVNRNAMLNMVIYDMVRDYISEVRL
jgi:hypothetical protein